MLRDVIRQRTSNGVLQQHLVGLQTVAVNRLYLSGVEVHRHHADGDKHTKDYVEDGDTRW